LADTYKRKVFVVYFTSTSYLQKKLMENIWRNIYDSLGKRYVLIILANCYTNPVPHTPDLLLFTDMTIPGDYSTMFTTIPVPLSS